MAAGPIQERNQDATVYVGGLDEKVSEALLWELFLQAGPVVNVHMPKDRISQVHQSYGFVEFMSEEDADYAIKIMNMIKLYGKPIRVNKAASNMKSLDVGANVFIGNLDPEIDEKLLYDIFSAFGVILQTPKIMRDPDTGNSKGFAFINFASFDASDAAMDAMNGQHLCNRVISVSYAFKKDTKGERHGSAAERMLAAQNPLSQMDRPHQLFADAPPIRPGGTMAPVMAPPPFMQMPGMGLPPPPMMGGPPPGHFPPPTGPPPMMMMGGPPPPMMAPPQGLLPPPQHPSRPPLLGNLPGQPGEQQRPPLLIPPSSQPSEQQSQAPPPSQPPMEMAPSEQLAPSDRPPLQPTPTSQPVQPLLGPPTHPPPPHGPPLQGPPPQGPPLQGPPPQGPPSQGPPPQGPPPQGPPTQGPPPQGPPTQGPPPQALPPQGPPPHPPQAPQFQSQGPPPFPPQGPPPHPPPQGDMHRPVFPPGPPPPWFRPPPPHMMPPPPHMRPEGHIPPPFPPRSMPPPPPGHPFGGPPGPPPPPQ